MCAPPKHRESARLAQQQTTMRFPSVTSLPEHCPSPEEMTEPDAVHAAVGIHVRVLGQPPFCGTLLGIRRVFDSFPDAVLTTLFHVGSYLGDDIPRPLHPSGPGTAPASLPPSDIHVTLNINSYQCYVTLYTIRKENAWKKSMEANGKEENGPIRAINGLGETINRTWSIRRTCRRCIRPGRSVRPRTWGRG